ncbi:non-ribosomal peptide synthase/polyketide synthase, partial [Paenibacillus sp. KR2-11]
DLARWTADGQVDFIGRIDHQAKIRGYRIETGEIESLLLQAGGVKETVVAVIDDGSGNKALCAYYVPEAGTAGGEGVSAAELRDKLSQTLPGYMIPSYFVELAKLPLTPNGKIDRKALPAPQGAAAAGAEYVAPRTELEAKLARVWEEVLGTERIGVKDNFFERGGHSLRATTLASRVYKELGAELPLREVFRCSTVEAMARLIEGMEKREFVDIPKAAASDYYPLSSAQKRLFILQQLEGAEQNYNMPGTMVIRGRLDYTRFEEAFRGVIARHETLRTGFELVNGEPVQRIHPQVDFQVEYLEAAGQEGEPEVEAAVEAFVRTFDLTQPPLLRVGLLRIAEDHHILLFDMHHIISDGVSTDLLVDEFTALYSGEGLPELRLQYKDYAVWQQSAAEQERIRAQEAYWLEMYRGELPVLEMPLDYARPAVQNFDGGVVTFAIAPDVVQRLKTIAADRGATLFMALFAAYNTLLHKYTGQEDLAVGTPIAGRTREDLQGLIGMFVGTLAVRSFPAGTKPFTAYLDEIKETMLGAYQNQEYPFESLVEKLQVARDLSRNPVFDTMFVLQNTENKEADLRGLELAAYPKEYNAARFDLTLDMTEQGGGLECRLEYASALYKPETMERFAKHFGQLLESIGEAPSKPLALLGMLTESELALLQGGFNGTDAHYPQEQTIHGLFEEQAERTPDALAVVYEGQRLTYRELNERANRLARTLRGEGVAKDSLVGLMVRRSADMVAAVLAVLKAGGAYVPIDPEYPEDRIRYMLDNSGAGVLLTETELRGQVSFGGRVLAVDDESVYAADGTNPQYGGTPDDLAYVIYTSGTTGKPKGVMLEHRGLVSLKVMLEQTLRMSAEDRVIQFASLSFDASVWEMLGALYFGASLHIPSSDTILDYAAFERFMNEQEITTATLPPSYAAYLQPERLPALKKLITAGSAVSVELVQQWKDSVAYFNAYGPTEDSICSTIWQADDSQLGKSVPIGGPLPNHRLYMVDSYGQLLPVGAAGELCVAGAGLARGYLNRPDLTAEKFVDNPFESGGRMYRTGDLARWLPDGTVEYLGRIDHQVKIRGYRIELGEIEEQLLKTESVQEAIVIAHEDAAGQKQLCAYFTAEQALTAGGLRAALAAQLPGYMVPSFFVQLERMPLTPNGKIDRKALPAPEESMLRDGEYVAPRTPEEKALADVWQAVLGTSRVGVTDHFFELGGDSIKSIQVSSRLHGAGYRLEIRDLFKYPTIAQLGAHLKPLTRIADQGEVTGDVTLPPIQRWFFGQQPPQPQHFNQAVMLLRKERFDEEALRLVLGKLAEHHDALRIVYKQTEQGVEARNRGIREGELVHLEVADFRSLDDCTEAVEARANAIHRSIDLEAGPLLKAGLFRCPDGDHLLLVIHHGAVDGVSWRILLEDLSTGYEQAVRGEELRFPAKTDAYRLWSAALAEYAQSPAMEEELAYWLEADQAAVPPLPRDRFADTPLQADSESVVVQLSSHETRQLLQQANQAYRTEVNDILLTALGTAVAQWGGMERMRINLEGHGRESILTDVDVSRTVGWFTSKYPLLLEVPHGEELGRRIKRVKESLRRIPNKGIGYGMCRYLRPGAEEFPWGSEPEIGFNYLGQFDAQDDSGAIGMSPYGSGEAASGRQPRSFVLDITGMVAEGSLSLDISYSPAEYDKSTIESLAALLQESLSTVIAHCAAKERPELTPSDVQYAGLTAEELEHLESRTREIGEIENIYSLTPMQQGMWFHSALDREAGAYYEQTRLTLAGQLDPVLFEKSWNTLAARHAVLRTGFHTSFGGEPLQVVFRQRPVEYGCTDVSGLSPVEYAAYLSELEEQSRTRGFRLDQDALMRVQVLRTAEDRHEVLWSFHHILMDGWCLPQLTQELLEAYEAYAGGGSALKETSAAYGDYIGWLERQDREAAGAYWKGYMAGYDNQTLLPLKGTAKPGAAYEAEHLLVTLDRGLSDLMQRTAKRCQVTVNTLVQAAWGVLLQKYNGTEDVVFGSVVSGRPAEIEGIEAMIGLFINTIPVRVACAGEESFAELLGRLQEAALESARFDYYPLYEIQAATAQKQELIQHVLAFENFPVDEEMERSGDAAGSLRIADVEIQEHTNYDFTLTVMPGEELAVRFDYNAAVFGREGMKRMLGHLRQVLEQAAAKPETPIGALELATAEERAEILGVFNDTAAEYPTEQTIHGLFEEQAARRPEAVAVVFEGQTLTYGELNERANRLARTLRGQGVQPDAIVGLMTERSAEMIVGLLGILKAGGAYVPIDPQYPQERVRYMLEDSGASVLLSQRRLQERVPFGGAFIALDEEEAYHADGSSLEPAAGPDHLAYVIYTSGTTGKPKGVMVEHHGLVSLKLMFRDTLGITENDRIVQFASFSFDASCWEIYKALFFGAALYIPTADTILDYRLFERFMAEHGITAAILPPTYAAYLNPENMPGFRTLITGGSAASLDTVEQWKKHVAYFNAYGPTEASIVTSVWKAPEDLSGLKTVPIGRPLANHRIYVMDAGLKLQPVGVAGELCIAGVGLARGYLNRPELTDEKFVADPLYPGERMYRTGDLVRWMPDGTIEYLGRIDDQVKIRGYRIELGEVETQLGKVEGVLEAAVTARDDEAGQKQLCAYYTAVRELTILELRTALASELPGYMIPSHFVQLEQMPLTPNGKIDRKALPAPQGGMLTGASYVEPRTPLEAKLAEIWQDVLGTGKVGATDHFFELGGHSLRVTALASRVGRELNVTLPLKDVFAYPTLAELAQRIGQLEEEAYSAIPAAPQLDVYPVSSAQKRLYILHQLEGAELSYNMPGALLVEGRLDKERFEGAMRALIARHDSLRTGFEMAAGEPVQRVHAEVDFAVEYGRADESEAASVLERFVRTFELEQPPLLRVGLVELGDDRHILLFDMHHIISDGVSMDIFVEEFVSLYAGESLPPLRIQYKDYAVWQGSAAQRERLAGDAAYWLDQFRGELPVLELPADYPRPAVQSYEGQTLEFSVSRQETELLNRIAAENGATLYMVLLAAYKVLLHKYTGQEDLVVGTPIAGRTHADLQGVIGMFVNTLAVRSYPLAEKTFLSYLEEIKATLLGAYEHQNYPFEELVDSLNVARDLSRNPLFDTMFTLHNTENKEFELAGLALTSYEGEQKAAKFDVSIDISEGAEGLEYSVEYATALFKRETMQRFAGHYAELLRSIAHQPDAKIASLGMLTAGEKEEILHGFNPPAANSLTAPLHRPFHELFEEQAARTPEAAAVAYPGSELSYRELNERANVLARRLRSAGVAPDRLVGILADRSVDLVVAALAVWKAGGAYVPIDPDYPAERIRLMLEDSEASVLLTQSHLLELAQQPDSAAQGEAGGTLRTVLCLDDASLYEGDASNLTPLAAASDLAYVIYTSGTTGRPKGVMIEHRSLVNTADGYRREYRLDRFPVRLLQLASFSFDVFVGDIARTLYNGGLMFICPKDDRIDPARLHHWITEREITVFESTPALIVPFMEYVHEEGLTLHSMELLITSSDSCSVSDYRTLQERFGSQMRIINAYGVTEAAIDSSFYDEPLAVLPASGNVPIGRAYLNAAFYIVDAYLNPVPVGVLGELCIGGAGVARGYWNREDLTAEKFVDSPFAPGEKLYRTGDLARWTADGQVDFIGRIDHQAKIRGYRIETGEIESLLLQAGGVKETVVAVIDDGSGNKALCAYYVPEAGTAGGEGVSAAELRDKLSQTLPGYMIPSYFVELAKLPLTPNGKIDRKALPAPQGAAAAGAEYVAPRTELEAKLVRVWEEVLGAERIGVKDNFFERGGHSLRATTLASRVYKELGAELPLREVFRCSTVEAMARLIEGMEKREFVDIPKAAASEYYPLSSAQKRLYILQQLEGAEQNYNMPGTMVVHGTLDRARFEEAFRGVIARHETLRTSFMLVDGEPVQQILPQVEFAVEYLECGEEEAAAAVEAFVRTFDLAKPPLLRVGLIRLAEERHILMFDMHHIVSDGVSTELLLEEFVALYSGEELPALRIQYKDYAVWQQSGTQLEARRSQEAFWLDMFHGELPVLEMPLDYPRPPQQKFGGARHPFRIPAETAAKLQRLAAEQGATLYMVLLAAYKTMLQKYTGQEDLVVGTPSAGRTHEDLQGLIGMFVNTLAIRSYPAAGKTFRAFLDEIRETMLGAYEHQAYPFEELTEKLHAGRDLSRHPLFDTMFVLQNTESRELELGEVTMAPYPSESAVARFDLVLDVTETEEGLECYLEYATSLYKEDTVNRMAGHYSQLLAAAAKAPDQPLAALDMLSAEEEERIRFAFNATEADFEQNQTIHGLFEDQAARTPDHTAVVYEGASLTYRELNERANRLAHTLRSQGVRTDEPVGLMVGRSLEMIVGIFAIMKAGGAYVPIDPAYPQERIAYMLEDSGARLLLVQSHLAGGVTFGGTLLAIDNEEAYAEAVSNPETVSGPNDLAYIIYTSGTTGKPKGVMVEHRGLLSFKVMVEETMQLGSEDRMLQFASFSFDASSSEIFHALFVGAALYIPNADTVLDYVLFEKFMNDNRITAAILPPNYAAYLQPSRMTSLKKLVTAGSAASVELVHQWKDSVMYYNAYGPTEDSICTTIWSAATDGFGGKSVPIGRPIQNHRIYIVDANLNLLPVGVAGELCAAGVGLARGYLNRPDLTAEKFVDNPFEPGSRMYRTGDLARWLPDGSIEYLGRIDHQVKIRGYRIELGEVEEQLLRIPAVQEAIVIAREDAGGQKQLAAYFVAEGELSAGELRSTLSGQLPGYMIPAYFVRLESMPLTPNGKIDRKALPAPEGHMLTDGEYAAPRTEAEKALAAVWQSVLGIARIGLHDHFFNLGGDSIKSIQVSSRLHAAGYRLEIKDLFKYPTLGALAPHLQSASRIADQRAVEGDTLLAPIQAWFFGQEWEELHHFNQSVMLHRPDGFDEAAVRSVLGRLAEHHDALRMVFRRSGTGYTAWNRAIGEGPLYSLEIADYRGQAEYAMALEARADEIQRSMDLEEGPLLRAGLFRCDDGDHLLLAVHHGVVDGVSWRILLEDVASGYGQAVSGQEISFPLKTDAYRSWTEALAAYAQSGVLDSEAAYWQAVEQTAVAKLPRDVEAQRSMGTDSRSVQLTLSEVETEQLLKGVHRAYNTEVNDILLTALAEAIGKWSGQPRILVNLEGHGREDILEDIDITRTVGWFTSKYPVLLDPGAEGSLGARIKKVKEDLRAIPNKGIGYGLLRYLSKNDAFALHGAEPEISFNYLGQFDAELDGGEIGISPYAAGAEASPLHERSHALDITGMVAEGRLSLDISYSGKEYRAETIEHVASLLKESLQELIAHCAAQERSELTPSDIQFRGLRSSELDRITESTRGIGDIENIYMLTPMQKGMWFHNTLDRHAGAYIEQTRFNVNGMLDPVIFAQSWNELAARHAILRTNFYSGGEGEPLQIVYRSRPIGFASEDIRHLGSEAQEEYIRSLVQEDKRLGFDLERDALMRVTVLRLADERSHVLWSFHHILMDGWCLPQLTQELFEAYDAYASGSQPERTTVPSYSRYIEWLEKQDAEAAEAYWSRYLEGYEEQTALPQAKPAGPEEAAWPPAHVFCELDRGLTAAMNRTAKGHQATLNTLLQAVWGILLQKYNGTGDVVFGSVVSGRPADIPGIEEMIGLFINTIPVRVACGEDTTFSALLEDLQAKALESARYDYYPLYEIQARSSQKQELINHLIAFENFPVDAKMEQAGGDEEGGLDIADVDIAEQTNYDLTLTVVPGEELMVRFDYNPRVFDESGMQRLMGHLKHVLAQITGRPQITVGEIALATPEEEAEIIEAFNATAAEYARGRTIHSLFEDQAARRPDAAAAVYGDVLLTYGELNIKANRLARTLREAGVGADTLVGLMTERSIGMVVSMLAILKAGGAYVPIDPEYPEDRIRYMLEDSGAQLLLVPSAMQELAGYGCRLIALDEEAVYHGDGSNLEEISGADHLAYVIYTSGTTGKPKGVMVGHENVVRLVDNTNYAELGEHTRILQTGAVVFDASTFEVWGALLNGGQLYLIPGDDILDAKKLKEAIRGYGINTMWLTAPLFNQLSQQERGLFDGLGTLIVGGDVLSIPHINRALREYPHLRIVNGYGPTENTTFSTTHPIEGEQITAVPIGAPISNSTAYVVDKKMRLQPVGVWGELIVGGDGVARGYLNRPDLTAEKFLASPFREGERCYRSGDLVRWLPDGTLEYKGRIDEQVKIRGYRIELSEVEGAITRLVEVKEAAVIARSDDSGQKLLCAYYVAEHELSVTEIRGLLSHALPGYMMPSYFVQLDKLPLTPNGKVDRRSLPEPEGSMGAGSAYEAPRTPVEAKLAEIWQEVLGLAKVGIRDHFFEIGGHSLRATVLVSRVHKELHVQLPLRDVFRYPTVAELAEAIEAMDEKRLSLIPQAEQREVYPVSSAQRRMYLAHQLEGAEISYNVPGVLLLEGPLDIERVREAFRRLIDRHETLRTGFHMVNGEPVQRILPSVDFEVSLVEAAESEADEIVRGFIRRFELEKPPLFRAGVIRTGPQRHILMLDMHHIISDGTSAGLLQEEFARFYAGEDLPPLRIQYKDFAVWQHSAEFKERLQAQESYWLNAFRGSLPVLDLPTDYERPAVRSFEGDYHAFEIESALAQRIGELAAKHGSTLFMVLSAAYSVLLSKYSGQDDLILGTPVAGRTHTDVEGLIGMFVNTLALRYAPQADKSFLAYLEEIKGSTLESFQNQDYPLEELIERLPIARDSSRSPLFDAMFVLQNTETGATEPGELQVAPYETEGQPHDAKVDLTLFMTEEAGGLQGGFRYAVRLFKKSTIRRMAEDYTHLLGQIADHPETELRRLSLPDTGGDGTDLMGNIEFAF